MSCGRRLARLIALGGTNANELDRLARRPKGSAWLLIDRDTDPRSQTARVYAEVLGVTLDWLIAGKGPDPERAVVEAAVEAARARAAAKAA
jgi:hypothetical protein